MRAILVGTLIALTLTTSVQAWSADSTPDYSAYVAKETNPSPCTGNYAFISVSGEGSINACVMGKEGRVASYALAQGGVGYAVSFPSDTTFYRLDICGNTLGCVYAEENDTFVSKSILYKQFLAHLSKTIYNGVTHYQPNTASITFPMTTIGNLSLVGKSVAISSNGKWVLIETPEYGIFRIDVRTFEMRRVIAPGISYGWGIEPAVEMAITNDGSTITVMGTQMGVWVVLIDETCGDHANQYMQRNYTGAVTACRYVPTQTQFYTTNFLYASGPRFSENGNNLSFDVLSYTVPARHIVLYSNAHDDQSTTRYIAIGDSFTSGEGEPDNSFYLGGDDDKCHVSTRSYPFLLANVWEYPVTSVACSGATMDTARGKNDNSSQPNQLAELDNNPPLVTTIGISGNDAGLIGKLKDCLGIDTCKWASTDADRRKTALEIKNLYPRLKDFYKDVKARTLGGVVVIGYPLIITSQPVCGSPIGALLNQTERQFMNESIHYLNQVIRAAALDANVKYADVEDVYSGGELCSSLISPLVNAIRIGDDYPDIASLPFLKVIGSESFHPKPEGHVKVANKILSKYSDPNSPDACNGCNASASAPPPSSYWNSASTDNIPQLAGLFLNKATVKIGDTIEISLPALSFQPSSDITIELHSEVKNLGVFRASDDGSLKITLPVNDIEVGYHSVHVIGKNFAGNEYDTYAFLEIEAANNNENSQAEPANTGLSSTNGNITPPANGEIFQANLGTSHDVPLPVSAVGFVKMPLPLLSIDQTGDTASGVLGASTLNTFAQAPKGDEQVQAKQPSPLRVKKVLRSYNWPWVIGIGIGFLVIGGAIYTYYCVKRSRKLNG